jgi:hypothetical protein
MGMLLRSTIAAFRVMASVLLFSVGEVGAEAVDANDSPITVILDAGTEMPRFAATSAATLTNRIVGRASPAAAPQRVKYEDQLSFGLAKRGAGWLLRYVVSIPHDSARADIALNVIVDGTTGDFVAAYTDPNQTWFHGMMDSQDTEEVARMDGWVMGATAPDSMQSTAAEAILAAWEQFSIDPSCAGQVVLRPRWISARFPAREVDGKLVPIRPTEKVWLVQVCGTKLHPQWSGDVLVYDSGEIMQFRDGTLEYVRGIAIR